jgi:hypothetical protein
MFVGPERFVVPDDIQAERQIEAAGQHFSFVVGDLRSHKHLTAHVLRLDFIRVHKTDLWDVLLPPPQIPNDTAQGPR